MRPLLAILLLVASASASAKLSPPTFIVDTQGNPWFLRYMQGDDLDFYGDYEGYTLQDDHIILIKPGQDLEDEQEVVVHETMHAILGPDRSAELAPYHQCIYAVAHGLAIILRENPTLELYLAQKP